MTCIDWLSIAFAVFGIHYGYDWAVNCAIGGFVGSAIGTAHIFYKDWRMVRKHEKLQKQFEKEWIHR